MQPNQNNPTGINPPEEPVAVFANSPMIIQPNAPAPQSVAANPLPQAPAQPTIVVSSDMAAAALPSAQPAMPIPQQTLPPEPQPTFEPVAVQTPMPQAPGSQFFNPSVPQQPPNDPGMQMTAPSQQQAQFMQQPQPLPQSGPAWMTDPFAAQAAAADNPVPIKSRGHLRKIVIISGVIIVSVLLIYFVLAKTVFNSTAAMNATANNVMTALAAGDQAQLDQYMSSDLKAVLEEAGTEEAILEYTKTDLTKGYEISSTYHVDNGDSDVASIVYQVKDSERPYFGIVLQKTEGEWQLQNLSNQEAEISAKDFLSQNFTVQ